MWWMKILVLGSLSSIIVTAQDCSNKVTCSDCIQAPSCVWCSRPGNLTDGERELDRCVTRWSASVRRWIDSCGQDHLEYPENYLEMLINEELSFTSGSRFASEETIVQLKPQRVQLQLRVEEAYSVQLTYNQAKGTFTKVEMKDNASESINIQYFSKCKGTVEKETSLCDHLTVGDTIEFRLEIKVSKCPASRDKWNHSIKVYPVGLTESLIIDIKMICDCNCEQPGDPGYKVRSEACNGLGTSMCGVCSCDEGFAGPNCECGSFTPWGIVTVFNKSSCRQPGHQLICSGRGTCSCGECRCNERQNYQERIDGKYCQCTNFLCERHNGNLCNGPDRGKCICNECECESGWTGPACSCEDSQENCMNPDSGLECSGTGKCECNKCKCYETNDGRFSGKWCEDFPTCRGKCEAYKSCVQCLVFQTGELTAEECETNCTSLNGMLTDYLEVEEEGRRLCTFVDENDCRFNFVYGYYDNEPIVRVQQTMDCPPKTDRLGFEVSVSPPQDVHGLIDLGNRYFSKLLKKDSTSNRNHTITFTTRTSMFLSFRQHTVGTLAYVMDDDSLFMRGAKGWRQVMLGVPIGP